MALGSIGFKQLCLLIVALVLVIIANLVSGPRAHEGDVVFLADDEFYPELLKDIDRAESSIHCALYMFKTDSAPTEPTGMILSAMIQALERGVDVALLLDMADKRELSTQYNTYTGKTLEGMGARVVYDDPERRLHTKMCIIDGKTVLAGSHNYTYSAMKRNAEVSLKVHSAEVAKDAEEYLKGMGL
jgi:phosphatidylserine/phosphatidylglycerophosphate/cardiolipin synthase-like enzyme